MRRAAVLLLALALPAAAQDWAETCARLASDSAEERESAIEALRRAGPEADSSLAAASSSGPAGGVARALVAARRWDPEFLVGDIDLLAALDTKEVPARGEALRRLAALGSAVAGRVMQRIVDSCADVGELRDVVQSLDGVDGRDPGWAQVASRWILSPDESMRRIALSALLRNLSRSSMGDMRIAYPRAKTAMERNRIWRSISVYASSTEELPPLPAAEDEYLEALNAMAGSRFPAIRKFAWESLSRREPQQIPMAFWNDAPRLMHHMSWASLERGLAETTDLGNAPEDFLDYLAASRRVEARASVANLSGLDPAGMMRWARLLVDPDESVRSVATHSSDRWDFRAPGQSDLALRESITRVATAFRTWVDASALAARPEELRAATAVLVREAIDSPRAAEVAYAAFSLSPPEAIAMLAALDKDKDLGEAARRARRLLQFSVPASIVEFDDGLRVAPRVRGSAVPRIDLESWKTMARSEEEEEKILAADLASAAWDRMDTREAVGEVLKRLAGDESTNVSQMALAHLSRRAPGLLPDKEELDQRDIYARSRAYVLQRLRKAIATKPLLDRRFVWMLMSHGDRSLVLSTMRSSSFDNPATAFVLYRLPDPGYLPLLLDRIARLDVTALQPQIMNSLVDCSPSGLRFAAAFALDAAPDLRSAALAALLRRPWADEFGEEALIRACTPGNEDARRTATQALLSGPLRSRPPLSQKAGDATARFLLRLADDPADGDSLENIVMQLGESMVNCSPDLLARLRANRRIAAAAESSWTEFSSAVTNPERCLRGDVRGRWRAMRRLPAGKLETVRLFALSWLNVGDDMNFWNVSSSTIAQVALLAWAADDPASRDALLTLRRAALQQLPSQSTPPAWQVVETPIPPEFDGDSEMARRVLAGRMGPAGPVEVFENLCAAAFRGSAGDEIALGAVLPRLAADALPRLVPLLASREAGVRALAAQGAGRLGADAREFAVAALRGSLAGEENIDAKAAKLAALVRLRDPGGIEEMGRLAAAAPDDRLAAARALANSPTKEGAALLATLANDDDFPTRAAADQALTRMTRRDGSVPTPPWKLRDWDGWLSAHPEALQAAR